METRKATKSPDVKHLADVVDMIEEQMKDSPIEDVLFGLTEFDQNALLDCARWACDSLNTRKVYHKRNNIRKKEFERLAKQHLSADEIRAIETRVANMTEAELLDSKEEND